MAFSVDLNKETETKKTVSFAAGSLDFADARASLPDAPSTFGLPDGLEEDRVSRTMSLSVALHGLFLLGLAFATVPLVEKPKVETITIEIAETSGPVAVSKGLKALETKGAAAPAAPAVAAAPAAKATDDDAPVIRVKPARSLPPPPKAAPSAAAARVSPKPSAKTSAPKVQSYVVPSLVEVPESLDDVDAPDLDDSAIKGAVAAQRNQRDLGERLNEKHRQQLDSAAKAMENDLGRWSDEDAAAVDALDQESDEIASRADAYQEGLRQRNAEALAAAGAEANREAIGRAAAARAAAEAARGAAKGTGNAGSGSGAKGSSMSGVPVGVPGGIRRIEELRQMPGNPLPKYSEQERIMKQQGITSFLAYISRDGVPTQFKQVRSTGHQNLDAKTLAALKKWRFYAGQEGWVEIPFKWDLRGGPQELSALSKRNAKAGSAKGSSLRTSN